MGEWRDAGGDICTGTAYTGSERKGEKSNQTQGKAREATWRCLKQVKHKVKLEKQDV